MELVNTDVYMTIWHALYVIITIPTIFGNGLIIASIVKFKSLRCSMHILIGNLAVADIIVGAVLIPFDIASDIGKFNAKKYVCLVKLSFFVMCLGCSCYSLLLISIERFIAIITPFRSREYFTKFKLLLMITFGWIITFVNGTLPIYGWNRYNVNDTECVSDTLYAPGYKFMLNIEIVAALLLNFVLYTIVMNIAIKKAKSTRLGNEIVIHTRTVKDLQQLKTMVVVLGLFVLCWFPYMCSAVIVLVYETSYTQFIRRCTLIPGMFNSAINWIIYGYRNTKFRKAFKTLLRFKSPGNHPHTVRNNNMGVSVTQMGRI